MTVPVKSPQRGEIWFVKLPSDPPDKRERPVVIVSMDERNSHERATTVLVVPLSTTPPRMASHILLSAGETGLSEPSTVQAEDITTVRKSSLLEPRTKLRKLSESTIERIARGVQIALGFADRL
jgi:mRNA-degrading endonuclease toxin of MazEF toxin-antitoxin module